MAVLDKVVLLNIVSDLARDRSVVDVAARHHVAPDVVAQVRNDFGPDLGRLAASAEKLRSGTVVPTEPPTPSRIDTVLTSAAPLPELAAKVSRIRNLVDQLEIDVDAITKRTAAEKLVAQRRAELKKAEEALAATKGKKALAVDDSTRIREWAKSQGLAVSERGRISADLRAKYEARS